MKTKKRCLHCGLMKLAYQYKADKRMRDGLSATCRMCPTMPLDQTPAHHLAPSFKKHVPKPQGATPARTFVTHTKYEPQKDNTYYRNDGNKHIRSHGVLC